MVKIFSSVKRVFPALPLEEALCSCTWDLLQSRSKDVSLWAEVHSHVLIVPVHARRRLGLYVFPRDMIFCLQTRFQWIRSRTILIMVSAIKLFRRPAWALSSTLQCSSSHLVSLKMYIREIFSGFKGSNIWEYICCNCEGQWQSHFFPWHHTECWHCDRLEQTALAQLPEETTVQKKPSLQLSPLYCLQFWTT